MAPWLVLALLGITVHAAPVLNGTDILPVLYPAKEVEGEPILLHSDFEPSPTTTTNENYEVFIGPTSESSPLPDTILPTPENEIIDSQPIADPSDGKWWCGNNTFSRGLAHAIAKHDENMAQINECCRVHDEEYDNATTFPEVEFADTRFDECLASSRSFYRTYIVRPLFNTAVNMNYAYEKFKSAFKSVFLGGNGLIDLK